MADSTQAQAQEFGRRKGPTSSSKATEEVSSPSCFRHPSQDPAGTETRDSPTMEALTTQLNEAVRISGTDSLVAQDKSRLDLHPTKQGTTAFDSCSTNGASLTYEEKQHRTEDGVAPPRAIERTTACTSGYIPTSGPKEQPYTNMNDVAKVDHVEEAQRHDQTHFMAVPIDVLPPNADIPEYDMHLLNLARHADPFRMLGCHKVECADSDKRIVVVRVWLKNVDHVELRPRAGVSDWRLPPPLESVQLERKGELLFHKASANARAASAFEMYTTDPSASSRGCPVKSSDPYVPLDYELLVRGEGEETPRVVYDTYSFGMTVPQYNLELFQSGSCWHVDNLMGSHIITVDGVTGVRFAVWAPNCICVSVVGDWNGWDGRAHPMRKRVEFGCWDLFIPGIGAGEKYGYRIHARNGTDFIKIDPYAQEFEVPPKTASIISACDDAFKPAESRYQWHDQEWMARRKVLGETDQLHREPMSIYEVHLPSWMRGQDGRYLSYRELADRLVPHVKNMNFTHVEFLPLAHHPFEGSWGYQVTGLYAPYSRLGNPDDFKYLVDTLHQANIGVFIDFVPAHFCKDSWGLVYYDGEPCYEYADPREGEHKLWGTAVFNYRRNEVRSFLLGAAYHWLRRYHIDGLRIDAVSSMLYKNHQKKDGEWLPNEHGGDANLQAISLLQELNWVVHKEFPGVFTMAEESTSWRGVTDKADGQATTQVHPTAPSVESSRRLGFDAKWDLGWMNDTLSYLCCPVENRRKCHNKLTFRGLYMAHERWILPLSHDEVVSGKGSLLDKCGYLGTPFEDRIRTLKTLYGFQIGMPGRPLIFMGGEIGQGREWKDNRSVDWHEGEEELRKKLCIWVSDLLGLYKSQPALHAGDDETWNFKWTDCDNNNDCIVAFLRSYEFWFNDILVVCNFSPQAYYRYPVGVPHGGEWQLLLNSDDWKYAGGMCGRGNGSYIHTTQGGRLGWPYCLWLDVPGNGCLYLKAPQPSAEEKRRMINESQRAKEPADREGKTGDAGLKDQPEGSS
ncbi:1,4-alpha-glucan branching enzyme, putative [Eimeria tenella]|uniref:1,4-alpha-glucan branching enzyme n=1 Tax=Eimeria tenella TaxID=5802 RepID=U6KZC7_EIMTE|nr:1,4-alpha-glucan branching enzyme, putative [Eimeria tenella]CDJ43321.1 1,4-alpha-glucan branching enzyme, putative [Eimeria tenella]|eukprot:XP_013234071.1 1,4-alpha-glucan branching enzyme, putative [Eimeria tenella]